VSLNKEPIGQTPEVAGANVKPLFLSFESLAGEDYFDLANVSENERRDLYAEPFFFKAIDANVSAEALQAWKQAEAERLTAELTLVSEAKKRREEFAVKEAKGEIDEAQRKLQADDDAQLRELRPTWLTWGSAASASALDADSDDAITDLPSDSAERATVIQSLVERRSPRVLARFESEKGPPFLVARQIGRGEVLLATTGLLSSWNTLPKTNAILIFDRMLRGMTQATLARRNFAAVERVTLPLPSEEHDLTVELYRPGRTDAEPLDIGYIGTEQRGITVAGMYERGVYRVAAHRRAMSADPALADKPIWEVPLVVNGPADESELDPLPRERADEIAAASNIRWVSAGEEISLAGSAIRGQYTWWYLILLVLLFLLLEMAILAWPLLKPAPAI